jgi:hypothetical protein
LVSFAVIIYIDDITTERTSLERKRQPTYLSLAEGIVGLFVGKTAVTPKAFAINI